MEKMIPKEVTNEATPQPNEEVQQLTQLIQGMLLPKELPEASGLINQVLKHNSVDKIDGL
jgi:hypothetical protein